MLWRESADLKRFRQLTVGHPIVMGRKTWDSLGRPLPGRRNIVVTRQLDWAATGAERAGSLPEALTLAVDAPLVFIIGGAQVYAEALPIVDELHLTEIDADFEADAFFPAWPRDRFIEADRDARVADDGVRYSFVTYRRSA